MSSLKRSSGREVRSIFIGQPINQRIKDRRKSPSPSWLGRSGDRSRKIRHITLRYLLRRAPCGALLGFRGASRAAPPSTMRPANRRKCLRFALMDAWYFQIAGCYVQDFSWRLPAGVSAPSMARKNTYH